MTAKHRIYEQTITYMDCCRCGIPIVMTPAQLQRFQDHGETFYCVMGHSQVFSEPEVTRLKKALRVAQDQTTQAQTAMANTEAVLDAEVKKRKKLEKRVHNGVCPDCNRSFVNLQRHMKSNHTKAK